MEFSGHSWLGRTGQIWLQVERSSVFDAAFGEKSVLGDLTLIDFQSYYLIDFRCRDRVTYEMTQTQSSSDSS